MHQSWILERFFVLGTIPSDIFIKNNMQSKTSEGFQFSDLITFPTWLMPLTLNFSSNIPGISCGLGAKLTVVKMVSDFIYSQGRLSRLNSGDRHRSWTWNVSRHWTKCSYIQLPIHLGSGRKLLSTLNNIAIVVVIGNDAYDWLARVTADHSPERVLILFPTLLNRPTRFAYLI